MLFKVGTIDGYESRHCIMFRKRLNEGLRLQLLGQKA